MDGNIAVYFYHPTKQIQARNPKISLGLLKRIFCCLLSLLFFPSHKNHHKKQCKKRNQRPLSRAQKTTKDTLDRAKLQISELAHGICLVIVKIAPLPIHSFLYHGSNEWTGEATVTRAHLRNHSSKARRKKCLATQGLIVAHGIVAEEKDQRE